MNQGLIFKATGGFYYVRSGESVCECRARGVFRKEGITPLVGDFVAFSEKQDTNITAEGVTSAGTVEEILPRKNLLVRPPVANLDRLVIVSSLVEPSPDLFAVDRLAAIAEHNGIEPVMVFTKLDLVGGTELAELYRKAGFAAMAVSSATGEGVDALKALLSQGTSAFTGNSGVGKTSLLNRIAPGIQRSVGDVSRKLGRGRHTTRTVELFGLAGGGRIADTPGFSSLDFERAQIIRKEELPNDFRDFAPYVEKCRFTGCSHTSEKGCAVIAAVEDGRIAKSRHDSYRALYDEVKDFHDWELKPKEGR